MNGQLVDLVAALEDFPKLARKVCASWGRPEFDDFLASLHSAANSGLPEAVAAELSFLEQIHLTSKRPETAASRPASTPKQASQAYQPPTLAEMEAIEARMRQAAEGSKTIVCSAALESIPRIAQKIIDIWGTPELDSYMGKLLVDSRDGARQGLPVAIAGEILFLIRTNKLVRALDRSKKYNIDWDAAFEMIDRGDQEGLNADVLDDPAVSRDTIVKGMSRPAAPRARERERTSGKQVGGFLQLVAMIITSKWLIGVIAVILLVKLFWPLFKALY